jgi:hypothetical protein
VSAHHSSTGTANPIAPGPPTTRLTAIEAASAAAGASRAGYRARITGSRRRWAHHTVTGGLVRTTGRMMMSLTSSVVNQKPNPVIRSRPKTMLAAPAPIDAANAPETAETSTR